MFSSLGLPMKISLCLISLFGALPVLAAAPAFHQWAQRPPMGWNSWDNFATAITEAQTKAQADYMAANLKKFGWEYIVVDIQWYEPGAKSHDYRSDAVLVMDDYGRLQPAANRFPSSKEGAGFKALSDYVHGLGLKFGIHLMRGIPRQAVDKNLPVKGTTYRAQDIANKASICPWNPDMYGVDMSKAGAQDYYDSVFDLIAAWGVDYVKVDDIARPYHEHEKEIEAIRRAIDRTGRPIVLSLSPGETALDAADHVTQHANLWRISDDFWDRWLAVRDQFARLRNWNPHRQPGAWPDADMLPFGVLELGKRTTRLTPDEQHTVMTLWSIARSPLMHGGDMTKTDSFTLSLLTNADVIAVNQNSTNNRPLFDHDELIAWTADVPGSSDKYLAVFNARDRIRLSAEHARYVSPLVTRAAGSEVAIDVDVSDSSGMFLVLDPTQDGNLWDHGVWRAPRFIFADGAERPLTDFKWTHVDAIWDSASVKKDKAGQTIGLGAQAATVIEYSVPAGAKRFKAMGTLDDDVRDKTEGGTVRFLVAVDNSGTADKEPGLPIAVQLSDLGLSGTVSIQDLWMHREMGEFKGEFSPVISWHGAGLYRLSLASVAK
jgi:alpha-galactosidase